MNLSKLEQRLAGYLGSYDQVDIWWNTPNSAFNNSTPANILKTEGIEPIVKYVGSLEMGLPYIYYE